MTYMLIFLAPKKTHVYEKITMYFIPLHLP